MALTRRALREEVFRVIFQNDFYEKEELMAQAERSVEDEALIALLDEEEEKRIAETSEEERAYILEKSKEIFSHIEDIDARIEAASDSWKVSRMAKVDLSLMRLAVYEICYEKIPKGVAINEAVELAKLYGSEQSYSFVNGVLARIDG